MTPPHASLLLEQAGWLSSARPSIDPATKWLPPASGRAPPTAACVRPFPRFLRLRRCTWPLCMHTTMAGAARAPLRLPPPSPPPGWTTCGGSSASWHRLGDLPCALVHEHALKAAWLTHCLQPPPLLCILLDQWEGRSAIVFGFSGESRAAARPPVGARFARVAPSVVRMVSEVVQQVTSIEYGLPCKMRPRPRPATYGCGCGAHRSFCDRSVCDRARMGSGRV